MWSDLGIGHSHESGSHPEVIIGVSGQLDRSTIVVGSISGGSGQQREVAHGLLHPAIPLLARGVLQDILQSP